MCYARHVAAHELLDVVTNGSMHGTYFDKPFFFFGEQDFETWLHTIMRPLNPMVLDLPALSLSSQ